MQDSADSMCSYKHTLQITNSEVLSTGLLSCIFQPLLGNHQVLLDGYQKRQPFTTAVERRGGPQGCWWVQNPAWPKESCHLQYNQPSEHLEQHSSQQAKPW